MGGIIFVTLCGIEFVTLVGIVLVQQGGIVFVGLGSIIVTPLGGFFSHLVSSDVFICPTDRRPQLPVQETLPAGGSEKQVEINGHDNLFPFLSFLVLTKI